MVIRPAQAWLRRVAADPRRTVLAPADLALAVWKEGMGARIAEGGEQMVDGSAVIVG